MGKRDKLREFIILAIECYNTAADPPCIDYARNTEPIDRLEYIPTNRATLLRIGIDVKHLVNNYLSNIPRNRAQTLHNWIQDGSNITMYSLSDYQRAWLKADQRRLKLILSDNKYQ
jgi:hypothetical protein